MQVRRSSIVIVMTILSVLVPDPARGDGRPTLTIVGFNARHIELDEGVYSWENRRDIALEILRERKADIIGLQEAAADQRRDLEELHLECVQCDPGFSNHNAILYRGEVLEVLDSGTFWLSDTPEVPESTSWGNELPRWVTWALLRPRESSSTGRDQRFFLYNTHLDHESQPSRMWSLHAIMAHARKHARENSGKEGASFPLVLMGDLNAKPDWPELEFLLQADPEYPHLPLRDVLAREGADEDADGTFHAFDGDPNLDRIDYILVSAGIGSRDGAIITEKGPDGNPPSDHFPVRAEIYVEGVDR